jgi:hypothetical protein
MTLAESSWMQGATSYARTFRAINISLEFLKPTNCSFHGIVPGSANIPLGRIDLDVCFGTQKNFRREKMEFEVMDWPSQYHAVLGQPVFSRFMEIPHYTCLVLKMLGPNSTITVKGSQISTTKNSTRWHKPLA